LGIVTLPVSKQEAPKCKMGISACSVVVHVCGELIVLLILMGHENIYCYERGSKRVSNSNGLAEMEVYFLALK